MTRDSRVSMGVIGICSGLYLTVTLLGLAGGLERWGLQPVAIAIGEQWFRLVSSIFLHAGLLHVGFNMYVLYVIGPPLEEVLGHGRFLTLFLLSGLGGSVASYAFSPLLTLSVGASGAIFGLMAAWIVVGRRLNQDVSQVVGLLVINVALGFLPGIDWRAHLGGAVTGAVVALALTTGRGQQGRELLGRQAASSIIIVLVLLAVVVWRTQEIRALAGV
ncbi:MAG: rhomboid family intramembrane serine protease [Candidatus Nanopelagicales bacterium]